MEKNYRRLGWNIKCLREAYHLTEEKLAYAVGVTRQAICNYENGSRIPNRDIIAKLASHFTITEDELIYGDFSNMTYPGKMIENTEAVKNSVDIYLPMLSSETSLKNNSFRNAFASHQAIYAGLKCGVPYSDSELEKCTELYEIALAEGVIEAAANLLWWFMFMGLGYSNYELLDGIEDLENHLISGEEFLQRHYLKSCDEESLEVSPEIAEVRRERRQFLRESEEQILFLLQTLKKNSVYSDLADYYLALRYCFGVVNNTNSDALNKTIGEEMMVAFSHWGNKYVMDFLRASQN